MKVYRLTTIISLLTLASLVVSMRSPAVAQNPPDRATFARSEIASQQPSPFRFFAADFNMDRNLDLVVFYWNTRGASISLGNGDGTFQPMRDFFPWFAEQMVAADFNRDGKTDVLLSGGTGTSFLPGNGDGTVGSPVPIGPFGLTGATGDFNSDGILDVVVSSQTILLLAGKGDGTFLPVNLGIPHDNWVVAADFNGDNKLDLACETNFSVAPFNYGKVTVLLGDGNGRFAWAGDFESGWGFPTAAVGDFNLDSKMDLVATQQGYAVSIHLGNGDGTFQPYKESAVGYGPWDVAVADFDGDAIPDIISGADPPILFGLGDGAFTPRFRLPFNSFGPLFTIADFNSDQKPDIAMNNSSSGAISILLNTTPPTAVIRIKIDISPGMFPNSINPKSNEIVPVAILTTDSFDASTVNLATVTFGPTGIEAPVVKSAMEDVNGDGRLDMVLEFRMGQTGFKCGDTVGILKGKTLGGRDIEGKDSIVTSPCK